MRIRLYLLSSVAMLAACATPTLNENATLSAPVQADAAAAPAAPSALSQSEQLSIWFDTKYTESLAFSPINKTFLGVMDEDYGEVDDFSLEAEKTQLAWLKGTVEDLKASFNVDTLSEEDRVSYELWAQGYEDTAATAAYPLHDYAFEQMDGSQGFFPTFLIQFHAVDSEDDFKAYISRINGLARATNQMMDRAETAASQGVRAPSFAYEGVIDQAGKVLTGAPFDASDEPSGLLADANAKLQALVDAGEISPERSAELLAEATAAYAGPFAESYRRVIDWHKAALPTLGDPRGVWSLPDGDAFYATMLKHHTTTDLSADEIHQIGLAEVARLRAAMEELKDSVAFEGSLEDFFAFVRTDPQFFYPDTDEGREAYLEGARERLGFIKAKLPDYFGILPKADLAVKRVESFREQDGAAQHYFPGTPDGSRPGIYYAHLSDMTAMPKNQMEVIAYHEGLPGHHMQIAIAQELDSVPEFRTQLGYTAYVEGWALYAEQLAKEMGAYEDPYSEFGRLSSEMFRAIRLVVDTGIHAKKWTEEEAVQYFLANSPEPEEGIRSEVQRYFVLPGQATSYKIGMIKILELREHARTQLGDKFDIRAFHDLVLGGGALPMDILEDRVDTWIMSVQAA